MANIKISELNEQENRNEQDLLAIVDVNNNETKKVKVKTLAPQNVEIVLISDTEPTSGINQGEMYYNTTTNKLYTYVGGGVYIDEGEPKTGILYIIFSDKDTFAYNGTTLISVGGGSGSEIVIGDETEATEDTKLIIEEDDMNLDLQGSDFLNEYSESTEKGYSCDYLNNHQTNAKILWTNPNPTTAITSDTNITLSSDDYDILEFFYTISTSNSQMLSSKFIKGYSGRITIPNASGGTNYRAITRNSDTSYTCGTLTPSSDNALCIPTHIVGYKTGLFN